MLHPRNATFPNSLILRKGRTTTRSLLKKSLVQLHHQTGAKNWPGQSGHCDYPDHYRVLLASHLPDDGPVKQSDGSVVPSIERDATPPDRGDTQMPDAGLADQTEAKTGLVSRATAITLTITMCFWRVICRMTAL
jgi:hypothetical protein